jgi:enoyl-CoA hydratase/carnithine racemase
VYERFAALPQPTIAAISGYCLGAGLELALAADFRIADETASFGFPEIGLGILPSSGGTQRLTRAAGPARAKELILLRERLTAPEALAAGIVTELAPVALDLGAQELRPGGADPPRRRSEPRAAQHGLRSSVRDVDPEPLQLALMRI